MRSSVEHYVCFYFIFFLCEITPGKIVFGVVPSKNGKESGLSSLCFNDKPMNFFIFVLLFLGQEK